MNWMDKYIAVDSGSIDNERGWLWKASGPGALPNGQRHIVRVAMVFGDVALQYIHYGMCDSSSSHFIGSTLS